VSALLAAAREAMVNASRHGGGQVSVYAEVTDEAAEVFVRDRGEGFDVASVPDDRHGLRESVVGRMERNGGTATVRSTPGAGTEVGLRLPRRAEVTP
jgi:signal transduction histidine kinase